MTDSTVEVDDVMLAGWCERLASHASAAPRIVFAEGDDPRVCSAADELAGRGFSSLLICESDPAHRKAVQTVAASAAVETTTVADLAAGPSGERVVEIGAERGWSVATTAERRRNRLYLAAAVVDTGGADACVAGSQHPSGDVIRAGIHVIGLRPDAGLLSSSFLLVMPDGRLMSFGDCAVVPEPDEHELAEIAVSTAGTFEALTGQTAAVAMLSFSTKGSADHESVRRVRAATALVTQRAPGLAVDGEMQFDAALVASVAEQKAAGSSVAGQANVFIFPNLAAGNIGYKIAQRLGDARAFGPIIQGLRAPMNDLSRGCNVTDIVNVAVISALQAQSLARDRVLDPA